MSRRGGRAWLSGARRRVTVLAVLTAAAILGLFVLGGVWSYFGPGPNARQGEITTVILEKGAGVRQIAAEDTRHSRQLLQACGIATPLTSLHEHNEARKSEELIERLHDAGMARHIRDAANECIADLPAETL